MAFLVQLFLPLYNNAGERFAKKLYGQVRDELFDRFGGLTVYTRAPASGLWQSDEERTVRDDLVIYEVMVEDLEEKWWGEYRSELEKRFRQQELVVRAHKVRIL